MKEIGQGTAQLIKALRNRKMLVRRNATEALGIIGDPSAETALRRVLRDRCWMVREEAGWALQHLEK